MKLMLIWFCVCIDSVRLCMGLLTRACAKSIEKDWTSSSASLLTSLWRNLTILKVPYSSLSIATWMWRRSTFQIKLPLSRKRWPQMRLPRSSAQSPKNPSQMTIFRLAVIRKLMSLSQQRETSIISVLHIKNKAVKSEVKMVHRKSLTKKKLQIWLMATKWRVLIFSA